MRALAGVGCCCAYTAARCMHACMASASDVCMPRAWLPGARHGQVLPKLRPDASFKDFMAAVCSVKGMACAETILRGDAPKKVRKGEASVPEGRRRSASQPARAAACMHSDAHLKTGRQCVVPEQVYGATPPGHDPCMAHGVLSCPALISTPPYSFLPPCRCTGQGPAAAECSVMLFGVLPPARCCPSVREVVGNKLWRYSIASLQVRSPGRPAVQPCVCVRACRDG